MHILKFIIDLVIVVHIWSPKNNDIKYLHLTIDEFPKIKSYHECYLIQTKHAIENVCITFNKWNKYKKWWKKNVIENVTLAIKECY